ncbi:mini-circle protein [Humibacillus sp. DSM 29435]|uniref:DinB family protein n=1 Tax=Humibacillus sp. DSM 29435 TaxID=1869167 RepID=UPI0008727665|nr:DinB family protein [Humibacillus sp. DSM 29435]OFE16183.1 mini-circle protein [Humibacillus sp. DSM 29435]
MSQPIEERRRPPFVADERTQIVGWLDLQREIVRWKCTGVSEADAHRVVIPTSPLMTVAGIVSHLCSVENTWFEVAFLDRPKAEAQFDDPDSDMRVEGVSLTQLLESYQRQCVVSNEIIAAHSLDEAGRYTGWPAGRASLRWMLHHMLEETARHAGHLDLLRELLDGEKGYY